MSEPERDALRDERAEKVAVAIWPTRYVGDLTSDEWRRCYAAVDALHPDQQGGRLYACRFNNATYAQPCDHCDGTCPDQQEQG
jgi:hypothetical protein